MRKIFEGYPKFLSFVLERHLPFIAVKNGGDASHSMEGLGN
jgi:hypothetical protein